MSKSFKKLVAFSAIAGAAAAGAYYYLQKKNNEFQQDYDDIDDFEDDLDEDSDVKSSSNKNRSYVSLDLNDAKEMIGEKVIETLDKTKEKIVQFNVAEKLDKAKDFIGEMTAPQDGQSVSSTYASDEVEEFEDEEDGETEDSTEEFFDDTDEE